MSEEVTTLVDALESFRSHLTGYLERLRSFVNGPGLLEDREKLLPMTDRLTAEAGGMRPIVEPITGPATMTLFRVTVSPWSAAFTRAYGNPAAIPSLEALIQLTLTALGYLRQEGLRDSVTRVMTEHRSGRPKICIFHDGESSLREILELECWRIGVEPIVVDAAASLNESVDEKVERVLRDCTFAIVLARRERGAEQDGGIIPRGNIIDEIGRTRSALGDNFIILLEEGLTFPTNLSTLSTSRLRLTASIELS